MDITTLVSFLGGGSVVSILFVYLLKKLFDKFINKKFSDIVAQGVLFLVSIVVAGIFYAVNFLPEYVIAVAGVIFTASISIYDVLKAMGVATGLLKK